MRKLVNAMEQSIAVKALAGASTAYGTSGQVPFGTAGDLSDFAGVAQLLDESGAPVGDRQLVLNSAAMANLRGKQSVLFKVNEAGTADMLRIDGYYWPSKLVGGKPVPSMPSPERYNLPVTTATAAAGVSEA